ncbi:MAG: peptide-methionine (S)-S-oxide reductase MsrA [Cyanobacteria bacterium P01_F01_bin.86]
MLRRWMIILLCLVSFLAGISDPAYAAAESSLAQATFAGGCFWCMEKPFDELPGVIDTTSGYAGGTVENPSYYEVSAGGTGHVEAVQVTYDPSQVSYEMLLDVFWHNIDPLDGKGQFCDQGSQYRAAIFYADDAQQQAAQASKELLAVSGKLKGAIATAIQPASTFYPAEDYHQNYYQTHPVRYKVYRFGCGRDQRLAKLWGKGFAE